MLSAIVAIANNNIIGGDNKLLWHIPEDLKRFKEITMNSTIIMGRKTFESLPNVLPGRKHIVLTKDKNYTACSDMVQVVHSLDEILALYKDSPNEAFILGGGSIYSLMLPYCNKLYLTKVNKDFQGDTYFPKINYSNWTKVYESEDKEDKGISYKFINYIIL